VEFTDLVRDALLHLYDLGHLQAHPLLPLVGRQEAGPASGSRLRLALLDAIEAVRPGPDVAPTARAWRLHHIQELRYVECHDVAEVMEQVALSSAQYHREHQRALQMVAVVLWERWPAASRWPAPAAGRGDRRGGGADPVRREAEGLVHDRGAGRVDLALVVRELRQLLRPLWAGRAIGLQFSVPERLPAVAGERVAVRQLLLVLLSHALAAVAEGTVEVRLDRRPRQVVLTIDGPASADPSQIDRGLAESRPFVEALQGAIRAAPPIAPPGRWTIQVGLPAPEQPVLLVVDNNAEFVRLVELYLTGGEWEVIGAGTVEEAVRLAQERRPDAILLDVMIPGRDGWDLLLELRRRPATMDIPAIICSVLNEPRMATALGAAAYLQKPVSQSQLIAALRPYH
jgi:CheY-like chemotaxis protein